MSDLLLEPIAIAKVTASGTGVVLVRGCAAARTAVGICTLTLDRQVDTTEGVVVVQPNTAALNALVTRPTDATVVVTTETDAGVDTDCDMDIVVYRVSGGAGR